jgi:hypothetical protein
MSMHNSAWATPPKPAASPPAASAADHRDKIARFMTAEQIAEGDRRAADWKPQQ